MSRTGLLVLLLVVAVGALGTWWFFENFEKREFEHYVGYQGEARSNPLLAARRFLRAMGIPAESEALLDIVDEPPPRDGVLLIGTERQTLGAQRAEELLEWVRAGGHLVVSVQHPAFDFDTQAPLTDTLPDPLLEPLGIGVEYRVEDFDEETAESQTEAEPGPLPIEYDGREAPLEVDFYPDYSITGAASGDEIIGDESATHVLSRSLGQGRLTVFSDLDFMTNDYIGDLDHAEFLWRIAHWGGRSPVGVWLVHDEDMPPLLQLLWSHAMPVIVTLTLLLLAWAAARIPRLGPLRHIPPPRRRRLLEHVEASGHFLWQRQAQNRLLAGVREALDRRLASLHPAWNDLGPEEREEQLAALCDLPQATVHELLHREDIRHAQDFTRVVQQLEDLRKRL